MTAPSPDPGALLDRLEEARQAATKGPWHVMRSADDRRAYALSLDRLITDSAGCSIADAALIVAAVNALPDLLRLARQGEALRGGGETMADEFELGAVTEELTGPAAEGDEFERGYWSALRYAADRLRRLVADTTGGA